MRTICFLLLMMISLTACSQQSARFDIPVFAYHRFGDDRFPSTNIQTDVFEDQLEYLKQNNIRVISLREAVEKRNRGEANTQPAVILTVDDGYLSFYTHALPLLKKYGYTATVFVQTETVGGNDFMSWQQLKQIRRAGIDIGNHSHRHLHFVNVDQAERKKLFREDLLTAAALFEKHLGEAPGIYAYPYGEWTSDMEQVLKEEGFQGAAVQKSGVFCEITPVYAIPRFPMGGPFATLNGFKNKLSMKALRISEINPGTPFFAQNPPELEIAVIPYEISLSQAQFFVDGKKTKITETIPGDQNPSLVLRAEQKLTDRRTLYTITAPSTDGKNWHWFSHLWINPQIDE